MAAPRKIKYAVVLNLLAEEADIEKLDEIAKRDNSSRADIVRIAIRKLIEDDLRIKAKDDWRSTFSSA